jgi:integrase
MTRHNTKNERIKWQYLRFLEDAKRMKSSTVDQVAAALADFEAVNSWKDFAAFHIEQARRFKRVLDDRLNEETGKPLAVATKVSRLRHVKAFFQWLAGRPGYKKLVYSDMEYFNPSNNEGRIASARRNPPVPTIEQIRHVLASMPVETVVDRRNRAVIAFTLISGARDAAIASLCLKHINLTLRTVNQDARDVKTKFRKTFTTWFFPVGDDVEAIVRDWVQELEKDHLFGPGDPLFPATAIRQSADFQFQVCGITRRHWSDAGPIRRIFKEAFEAAGLPYFNPHSFRKTLGRLGEALCGLGEEEKAWSLNLGHDHIRTTRESYGPMTPEYQAAVMRRLESRRKGSHKTLDPETVALVLARLQ